MRALLIGLLVLAMVAAGCGDDDDDAATSTTVTEDAATSTSLEAVEVRTTTVPPAAVIEGAFTFADDDLCAWVSEEEVVEFVAAEFEWDGTAVLEEAGGEEDPDRCRWKLTSTAGDVGGDVSAGNASTSGAFSGFDGAEEVVAFDEVDLDEGFVPIGSSVSGHPSLSDGVIVHNGAFGRYTFWVPPSDEHLTISWWSFEDGPAYDAADNEARFFGVADRFVQELGWLG